MILLVFPILRSAMSTEREREREVRFYAEVG
jgi:hypothetical protein